MILRANRLEPSNSNKIIKPRSLVNKRFLGFLLARCLQLVEFEGFQNLPLYLYLKLEFNHVEKEKYAIIRRKQAGDMPLWVSPVLDFD